jgi:hypothetical protein
LEQREQGRGCTCEPVRQPATSPYSVFHYILYAHMVTGEWRKLHNEDLSDLYSLPHIVRVVKSRRMRWAGHVARMGEGRGVHKILVGKPE